MDAELYEKLEYIFNFMDEYIDISIRAVLKDSKIYPKYSAIAVSNMIKCYISITDSMNDKLPYSDVKGYFDFNGYYPEEYQAFENSRENESRNYKGVQY